MSISLWIRRALAVAGVIAGLALANPGMAEEEKDKTKAAPTETKKKDESKKDSPAPEAKKKKENDSKSEPAPEAKKKPAEGKTGKIVQIDLSQLSPELAKVIAAIAESQKGKKPKAEGKPAKKGESEESKKAAPSEKKKGESEESKKAAPSEKKKGESEESKKAAPPTKKKKTKDDDD